jgi:zona occludens toxin (predicted ATPase)
MRRFSDKKLVLLFLMVFAFLSSSGFATTPKSTKQSKARASKNLETANSAAKPSAEILAAKNLLTRGIARLSQSLASDS